MATSGGSTSSRARREPGREILTRGFVHVVPPDGFTTLSAPVRFDEWHSRGPVLVVARLAVEPADFPFRWAIAWHPADESGFASWMRYKERLGYR